MTRLQTFAEEFENEIITTRKFLSIVPHDKFDWKPHPKSMTLLQLATHIAELPSWVTMTFETSELDFATNPYEPPTIQNREELLAYYDQNVKEARNYLTNPENEAKLDDLWVLRNGQKVYSNRPKAAVIRMSFNQTVHHRAQLGVFLRLLDIPIPGSYGPSADESFD